MLLQRKKPRRGRVEEDGNLRERQVIIPPEEPDNYDPKREPILQPGVLWAALYWVIVVVFLVGIQRLTNWVMVDLLGWFPRR